jgi:hypothetical protein
LPRQNLTHFSKFQSIWYLKFYSMATYLIYSFMLFVVILVI